MHMQLGSLKQKMVQAVEDGITLNVWSEEIELWLESLFYLEKWFINGEEAAKILWNQNMGDTNLQKLNISLERTAGFRTMLLSKLFYSLFSKEFSFEKG